MGDKGLMNALGENSCFLNATIQGLWHLASFRKQFQEAYGEHVCTKPRGECATCALFDLFSQFHFRELDILPSTAVRETLARLYATEGRFQLGAMDDANEVLEALLSRLHAEAVAEPGPEPPECCVAHRTFGMKVQERARCQNCDYVREPPASTLFVLYSYVFALQQRRRENPDEAFGISVREAARSGGGERCQSCEGPVLLDLYLDRAPEVFTLGLVWMDAKLCPADDLRSILELVSCTLDMDEVLLPRQLLPVPLAKAATLRYLFRGMVCFYGRHYNAYMWSDAQMAWVVFDDSQVEIVGNWAAVVERCVRGRLQPTMLFYERAEPAGGRVPSGRLAAPRAQAADEEVLLPLDAVSLKSSGFSEQADGDFVVVPGRSRTDSVDVELEVQIVNWYYRSQRRLIIAGPHGFCRALPDTREIRESYLYTDVANVESSSPGSLTIQFHPSSSHKDLTLYAPIESISILQSTLSKFVHSSSSKTTL